MVVEERGGYREFKKVRVTARVSFDQAVRTSALETEDRKVM